MGRYAIPAFPGVPALCRDAGPPAPEGAGGNAGSRQTPVWPLAPGRRDQQWPPHAPLGPALSGRLAHPRLAGPHRGQARRRQSRPVASSPLRTARLSTHHPLPWLIIDISRSRGEGVENSLPPGGEGQGGGRYAGRDQERCEIEPLRSGFLLLTNAPAFFNRPLHARYFFSLRQMAAARACRVWNWIDCRAGRV